MHACVLATSRTLSAHIGGLSHFNWLFRGTIAPIAPLVPPPMIEGEEKEEEMGIEIQRKGEWEIEGEERGTETGRKGKKVERRYF